MTAPWPEGSATQPLTHEQMLAYLEELGSWITQSRAALDRIDPQIQETGQGSVDMAMTLTIWQSIKDRYTDLLNVWDSGRVIDTDLKKLAIMTWANLNDMLTPGTSLSNAGGLSVSLPEACRMLDALITQLTSRYQLAEVASETSTRISGLLAQVERIRDQVKLDPPGIREPNQAKAETLAANVAELVDKMNRGGDIGGMLGPIEIQAAQFERDLIVSHAELTWASQRFTQASEHRAALLDHEKKVRSLAAQAKASVDPAPKYAVPRVEALGPVPADGEALDEYIAKLQKIAEAFDTVSRANNQALNAKEALKTRFESARSSGKPSALQVTLEKQIVELLAANPTALAVVEPLIESYEAAGEKP
ncbi:MAG: hypothetical protein FWG15_04845 [Propionibacteriaceae bacterium]|nr:hypothetical protein [Propionibacteriaceae bacterium]